MRTLTPKQAEKDLRASGSLEDAEIQGNLEFGFCPPLLSTEPDGLNIGLVEKTGDLTFSGMVVEGNFRLHHLQIKGSLDLTNTKIMGDLILEQVPIEGQLIINGLEVRGRIITNDPFQALQFFLAFGRNVYCDHCHLRRGLRNLLEALPATPAL